MSGAAQSETRFGPGQPAMWFFVIFDSFIYALYLISYVFFRMREPEAFMASQAHLDQGLGALNTVMLLTSSWLVARVVSSTRAGAFEVAKREVMIAGAFGLGFMAIKIWEWSASIDAGYTLTHSLFFSYYYFITGFHFIHMIIGMICLGIAWFTLQQSQADRLYTVETCATYWHMVDFLWVFIFALLYVMR
jgi:nitric oxide reductase NorE protein